MAGNLPPQAARPDPAARHYFPAQPTARELRAQAVHRLQIGLFGLCAMLLIVGLANIIMDRARLSGGAEPVEQVISVDAAPSRKSTDPLADLGVLPAADPTPASASDAAGTGTGPGPSADSPPPPAR